LSDILANFALDNLNTFNIRASAKAFIGIDSLPSLTTHWGEIASFTERFVLGGGSNLLFVGDFDGLVIYPQLKGIELLQENDLQVSLKVGASENWHAFVVNCLKQGYFGLENLALIPGTVGAAPVQNIGAYGVEVESFIRQVNCFDIETGEFVTLSHQECQFGYRDSLIKRSGQGRFIVTSVEFLLNKQADLVLSYKPLRDYFTGNKRVTAQQVFDRVCAIRSEKLPDPRELPNAGSFFKNPVIEEALYSQLKNSYPQIVAYPIDHGGKIQYKIAAGWLIEKAGFKGKVFGKVGVHEKQALVLVNYSDSNGCNVYALARQIMTEVYRLFNICLEPEVRILGGK
jgi:UDP-N-acetylmuramate dehydrogenase